MTLRRSISLLVAAGAVVAYGISQMHGLPSANSQLSAAAPAAVPNGSDTLIIEPDEGMAPITSLIASASTSVDLVMYQLEDTKVETALADDAARGVSVRVLLNGGYYGKKENADNDPAYQFLSQHGISVHWTPSYFALTHEKSFVIDGREAVVMTLNLTPQYYASGREFAVIDSDQSDASAAESTFNDDWNATRSRAANGDSLIWSPGSENAMISLIDSAKTSLDIYNEEMADQKIIDALAAAAQRGVAVRVTMTYETGWKSAFTTLKSAGVQVHTYAANAPLYIHAKMILADGTRAFLGSENFSANSLEKNRELGLIVTDPAVISQLSATFDSDFSSARTF